MKLVMKKKKSEEFPEGCMLPPQGVEKGSDDIGLHSEFSRPGGQGVGQSWWSHLARKSGKVLIGKWRNLTESRIVVRQ